MAKARFMPGRAVYGTVRRMARPSKRTGGTSPFIAILVIAVMVMAF